MFVCSGCVQLVHDSEEQAERDLEALHALEDMQLIDYSVMCPVAPTVGAVVIVDPFSTGEGGGEVLLCCVVWCSMAWHGLLSIKI